MTDANSKLPGTLQQAAKQLEDARRVYLEAKAAHAAEREREPYNKWARFDAKQAETTARLAYDQAEREVGYFMENAGAIPPRRRKPFPSPNWYTDRHGNLIVRLQPRKKSVRHV